MDVQFIFKILPRIKKGKEKIFRKVIERQNGQQCKLEKRKIQNEKHHPRGNYFDNFI